MKKILQIILALIVCTGMLSSCIIIKFNTTGLYSGCSKLSDTNKKTVVITDENDDCQNFVFSEDKKVYAINGKQLLNCLKNTDNAIVYIWSPHCSGTSCISLDYLQEKAEQYDYDIFIVAEYLTEDMFNQAGYPDRRIFCVNESY